MSKVKKSVPAKEVLLQMVQNLEEDQFVDAQTKLESLVKGKIKNKVTKSKASIFAKKS